MSAKILSEITVLDLTTFVTGGFCSLMLANQGAEVIKIERPDHGDDIRHSGPPFIGDDSPYFWTVNYDKKSVELDLQSEDGREVLYNLVAEADVFIQNFRPGTAERLEVDDEAIRSQNEEIVYCAISAFGQTGPWRERPGYDLLVQGLSGIMSVTGESEGPPVKVGLPQTDLITAMWAAFGILNALYERKHSGDGEYIDLSMLDATLPWLTKQAGKVFADESPGRMGSRDPVLAPYQGYRTADGFINIACANQRLWRTLCETIDREDLLNDSRFKTNADRVKHMAELENELESRLTDNPTKKWVTILQNAGIPAGAVQSIEDALYNEQTEARGSINTLHDSEHGEIPAIEHPVKYREAESGFETSPPDLGEHNYSVLRSIGYTEPEIKSLEKKGVFGNK